MKNATWMLGAMSAVLLAACSGAAPSELGDQTGSDAVTAGSVLAAVNVSCSTSSVHGLAQQLVDEIQCMEPGTLERIDGIPNVTVSDVVFPYLQSPAAAALRKAAAHDAISIDSALRTLPQQYLLYQWYLKGGHHCGVSLAAHVGKSNHEQGLAIDVADHPDVLTSYGFRWFGDADPVHWDFRGGGGKDLVGLSTKAFQRLWNRNNPQDKIPEDGDYGSGTEARLKKAPADGFSVGATCAAAQSNDTPPSGNASDNTSAGDTTAATDQ